RYTHAPRRRRRCDWFMETERGSKVNPPRRNFLHLAAGAAALPTASRFAWAQAYPTRPATMVVTFPPGSGSDILARILGPRLSELLGQQVIIESVGAGGGITGAYRV